jgi:hypothetical protein
MSLKDSVRFLDAQRQYLQRDRKPDTVKDLADALRYLSSSVGGPVVAASVVVLNETTVSIAVVFDSGDLKVEIVSLPVDPCLSLDEQIEQTVSLANTSTGELDWDAFPAIHALGEEIFSLVRRVAPTAHLLILAAEPVLASLPWNLWQRATHSPRLVVSLVPSLSWALEVIRQRPYWDTHAPPRETGFFLSEREQLTANFDGKGKKELGELWDRLNDDFLAMQDSKRSIAFVLGHGRYDPDEEYWTLDVYPPLDTSGWINEVGRYTVVIVHGCLCGRVKDKFVGDLSGIPGILLMQHTHLCCSPVTEVHAATAITLQKQFATNKQDRRSALDRYTAALNEDRSAGLYNLFGLPTVQW